MNAHNLPIASNDTSPRSMHREAAVGTDAATLHRVVPLHRGARLTDSRQIGPNEFEELGSPFHWTVYVAILAVVFAISAVGAALLSAAGQL